jgi:DNA repair protein RadA/Sms
MKDVFVNIAGGIKAEDPSIDLAIVSALLSSYEDVALPQHICFAGEVGLSGEIRAVNRIEQRIAEAEKLGFEKIVVSKYNSKSLCWIIDYINCNSWSRLNLSMGSEWCRHIWCKW